MEASELWYRKNWHSFTFRCKRAHLNVFPAMMQIWEYRAISGLLALAYLSSRGCKTQGKSKSICIEYFLMVCHILSSVLDNCGKFQRWYLRDYVEETIFTCSNYWRTLSLSCSSEIM